jgi:molecular chaperone GrpE
VLADFRAWLKQAVTVPADNGEATAVPPAEAPDLHTLLGQLIALRQEVNLQTRATRAQQEQTAEALRQLGQAVDLLRQRAEAPAPVRAEGGDQALRALLKVLLDLHDALSLAFREVQRVEATLERPPAAGQPTDTTAGPARLPWLARLIGAGKVLAAREAQEARRRQAAAQEAERLRQLVTSMVTGYTMSVQRLQRALQQSDLEPIATVGQPFDPEVMEAVEVVVQPGLATTLVIEEVRRGYLWRGRVFRFAQVKVARPQR